MQELAGENNGWMIGLMVIVACVAAPIVEETMFRGVLYRHLRDWIPGNGRAASVFFACLVNSFVFAAIHPQGLIGIPMLGLLAVGFSLVREWRDSLLGPILMHALNNGIITLILFTLV
jgi:membrane protease YdiL (CAAX protease family)